MKSKLHFGVLIILMAFFGRYMEHSNVPNQQIVIQFSDENISEQYTEGAIDAIEKRLQSIGVTGIQISQNENGQLKITYYSNTDVTQIQDILSIEQGFKLTYGLESDDSTDFPLEKTIKDYELNISEIQDHTDINWDFDGVEIVELHQKTDRPYNFNPNSLSKDLNIEYLNRVVQVAIIVNKQAATEIDNLSYKIPEVRAGPSKRGFLI